LNVKLLVRHVTSRLEKVSDLYSLPNIVGLIKSRMKWSGHVVRMGERSGLYGILWRNLRERGHLEDPDVDGRIILRWIFRKWEVGAWTGLMWLRIGTDSYGLL